MGNYSLGSIESRFAEIVWNNAPLTTRTLVRLSEEELGWKRTTTYTVLKKLCERGFFECNEGLVTVIVGRDEFYARQTADYVDTVFEGSLPGFVAAFTRARKLSEDEIKELKRIIDEGGK